MEDQLEPESTKSHKWKKKSSKSDKISGLLLVFGIVFLVLGFIYIFESVTSQGGVIALFQNLFSPSESTEVVPVEFKGWPNLLYVFLPLMLGLIATIVFAERNKTIAFYLSVLFSFALFIYQLKVIVLNFNIGSAYYPNFIFASVFLFLPVFLILANAIKFKNGINVIPALLYFYSSCVIYSGNYSGNFQFLFAYTIAFSGLFYYTIFKIRKPSLNLLNNAFALGFMGLFWLRKFVVNTKPDFLLVFLVFATAFYILFYVIALLASRKEQLRLSKWSQLAMLWGNFLFFAGTTGFVIIKFYGIGYLWILVTVLLLLHAGGIWWMKQTESTAWKLSHTFLMAVLASLLLPLLLQQDMVLIFMSGLSIGLLYITLSDKNKTTYWAYMAAAGLMLLLLAYNWFVVYLPALIFPIEVPHSELMIHGVVSTLAVMLAHWVQLIMLKDDTLPNTRQAPDTIGLRRILRVLMMGTLYGFVTWISSIIVIRIENSTIWVPVAWFIAGALFFIGAIIRYTGKKTFLKMPVLNIAFIFLMLYPLLVQWRMFTVNALKVQTGQYHTAGIVLHYIALAAMVFLALIVIPKIIYQVRRKPAPKALLQFLSIVLISLVICFEYENLYMLISGNTVLQMLSVAGQEIPISGNHYLAFSVLSGLLMVVILLKSLLDHDTTLRNIAFVLSGLILLKIFFYDFEIVSTGMRAVVFIVTGVLLSGVALVYPRLQKEGKQRYERRHTKKKVEEGVL